MIPSACIAVTGYVAASHWPCNRQGRGALTRVLGGGKPAQLLAFPQPLTRGSSDQSITQYATQAIIPTTEPAANYGIFATPSDVTRDLSYAHATGQSPVHSPISATMKGVTG